MRRTCPPPQGIPGRERTIILIPLQIFGFTLTAIYLGYSAVELNRRNQRSWHAIVNRYTNEQGAIARSRVAYRNAGVMMEMADYLERHARGFDEGHLRELRSNALGMRFAALRSLIDPSRR